ncbi:hypothetical protein [Sphingobium algorifonticola]|uniref:Lipoprotein n=1 Tax=Sphingobium algorifonticola TaxID=2008318 RepID=A0A437JBX4_9SPHN|nr:hypothetical protein [Sphingobium algorifonticola]RVT43399.1 hypothetical protein ENE74_01845 [Sphingobium algorifonticola]
MILPTALRRKYAATLLLVAALSACATPQNRVEAGLVDAGISPRMAACMADRMVDRLSLVQLRRLQSLSKVGKTDFRTISVDQFLFRVRALQDPEILTVTSKAALVCAIEG